MSTAEMLKRRKSAAQQRLMAAVGAGVSLCAVSRSGGQHPAAKYHEGAVVSLRDVDPEHALETAMAALERWRVAAERDAARSKDWAAYRTGGVDELESLIAELSGD